MQCYKKFHKVKVMLAYKLNPSLSVSYEESRQLTVLITTEKHFTFK